MHLTMHSIENILGGGNSKSKTVENQFNMKTIEVTEEISEKLVNFTSKNSSNEKNYTKLVYPEKVYQPECKTKYYPREDLDPNTIPYTTTYSGQTLNKHGFNNSTNYDRMHNLAEYLTKRTSFNQMPTEIPDLYKMYPQHPYWSPFNPISSGYSYGSYSPYEISPMWSEQPHKDRIGYLDQNPFEYEKRGCSTRFTEEQKQLLEKEFKRHHYLSPEDRKKLAYSLNLSDRQVKTWFQNRRAKFRRKSNGLTTSSIDD